MIFWTLHTSGDLLKNNIVRDVTGRKKRRIEREKPSLVYYLGEDMIHPPIMIASEKGGTPLEFLKHASLAPAAVWILYAAIILELLQWNEEPKKFHDPQMRWTI